MTYSAATITASVMPSFDRFRREFAREIKNTQEALNRGLTGESARSGHEAGRLFASNFRRGAGALPIDLNTDKANREAASLAATIKAQLSKAISTIGDSATGELRQVRAEAEAMLGHIEGQADIDLDTGAAMAQLSAFESRLARIRDTEVDFDVKTNAGGALAELRAVESYADRIDRDDVTIDVNVRGAEVGTAKIAGLGVASHGASHGVRQLGLALLFAGAAVPVLATGAIGLIGLLGAVAPAAVAAGAAIAAIGLAGSGVAGAMQAIKAKQGLAGGGLKIRRAQQRQDDSGVRLARAEHDAAARVADAKQSAARANTAAVKREAEAQQQLNRLLGEGGEVAQRVAVAKDRAAEANKRALKQEADAQKQVRRAVEEVGEAEKRLRDARDAAKNKGKDIAHDIKANKLREDAGVVSLFDADVAYKSTMADGSATNRDKELARIALEEARMGLEEIRTEGARLAAEQANWNRTGVEGTEEVKSAKESVTAAVEAQREAEARQAEAAANVATTRREGEADVAAAVVEGQQQIREAQAKVAEAHAAVVQTRADGEEKVREAVEAGRRSVDDARLASVRAGEAGHDAALTVADGFDSNASPAATRFAQALLALQPAFERLRADVAAVLLPPVETGLLAFLGGPGGAAARDALVAIAGATGEVIGAFAQSLNTQPWVTFFESLADFGPEIVEGWGRGFIAFFQGLASVMTALMPSAVGLADGFGDLMERFAEWAASPEGQQQIVDFMVTARDVGEKAGAMLWDISKAVFDLSVSLAPIGLKMLEGLIWLFNIDPNIVKGLAIAVGILAAAFTAIWIAANLPVAAVTLIVAAFVWAYAKFDWFRAAVDKVFRQLWAAVVWSKDAIVWCFEKIWEGLKWLARKHVEWYQDTKRGWKSFTDFVDRQAARLGDFFDRLGRKIMDFGRNTMSKAMSAGRTAIDGLKNATSTAIDAMGKKWDELKAKTAKPIRFVIEKVINAGMIAGFNKLGEHLPGKPKIPNVPVPKWIQAYASGGILPGYTPGRDVHRFVSPTGGLLDLSGGEAILRPEATSALGADWVNRINAAARRGGVAGVRTAVAARQAFAGGGIFAPVPGRINRHSRAQYPWANIAGDYPVPMGTPIRAYMDGIVASVKRLATSYGHHVRINHPNGSQTLYAHMSRIIAGAVGQQVKGGQVIGLVGSTGNSSGPHLHFEHKGGHSFPGMGQGGGPTADAASSLPDAVMNFIGKPLDTVKGWASGKLDAFRKGFGGNTFGDAIASVPGMAFDALKQKMAALIPDLSHVVDGAKAAAAGIKDAAGHTAVKAALRASALKMGWWKPSDMNGLMNIVQRESGFNVSAKNPSSTARGLFQLLYETGTRKPYGVHSLGEQIADGLGYIKGRYGSPGRAWDFWQRHHWYKDGGILPDFSGQRYNGSALRDTGGPLQPGITTVVNKTGKAEQVYTAEQHAAAQAALAATSRTGISGSQSIEINQNVTGLDSTTAGSQIVGEVLWNVKQLQRAGRYAH